MVINDKFVYVDSKMIVLVDIENVFVSDLLVVLLDGLIIDVGVVLEIGVVYVKGILVVVFYIDSC